MKLLIVDDEADIRRLARLALEKIGGMDVVEVQRGTEALEVAAAVKPDAILLDMVMPGLDGPGVLAALRADPRCAHVPVIFLTAQAQPDAIERLRAQGATAVLIKPFDPMRLAADVEAALGMGRPASAKRAGIGNPDGAEPGAA